MSTEEQARYLRKLFPTLIACVILLVVGAVVGFLSGSHSVNFSPSASEPLGGVSRMFSGFPKLVLALAIFLNNSIKTFFVILLGPLAGILPVVFTLVNGFAMGFLFYLSVQSSGIAASSLAIVPHAVFELPGVLLGTSIGLMLGLRVIARLRGKAEATTGGDLRQALNFFWAVILPLLFVGALVEAFVTSALISC